MNISSILKSFYEVADQHDWHKHQSPKNLSAAVSVEAAELLELFMWLESSDDIDASRVEKAGDEIADVFMYLLVLCDKLDLDIEQIVQAKLLKNQQRLAGNRETPG